MSVKFRNWFTNTLALYNTAACLKIHAGTQEGALSRFNCLDPLQVKTLRNRGGHTLTSGFQLPLVHEKWIRETQGEAVSTFEMLNKCSCCVTADSSY